MEKLNYVLSFVALGKTLIISKTEKIKKQGSQLTLNDILSSFEFMLD